MISKFIINLLPFLFITNITHCLSAATDVFFYQHISTKTQKHCRCQEGEKKKNTCNRKGTRVPAGFSWEENLPKKTKTLQTQLECHEILTVASSLWHSSRKTGLALYGRNWDSNCVLIIHLSFPHELLHLGHGERCLCTWIGFILSWIISPCALSCCTILKRR